ncbi:MAG: methylenetetrahydrofolate reductase [Candidatus Hadarchaeales archaeon]
MKKAFSNLMKAISEGKFVYTGELEPHRSIDLSEVESWARTLKEAGIVAANVTDNPRSDSAISSMVASYLIQRNTGLETIYQLRTADRNRLALLSDVLGGAALGLRNILALTGDHTRIGTTPSSKPVFDLDSTGLIALIHKLVYEGKDLDGNELKGPRPEINVGAAANPNMDPLEIEILKLERKAEAGADFFQTQVVFDVEVARRFLREIEHIKVPTLVGIFPPRSYGQAEFFDKYVPGVRVPKEFMEAFARFRTIEDKQKRSEKINEYNVEYFSNFIREVKKERACAGIHIMAVGYPEVIKPLMESVK